MFTVPAAVLWPGMLDHVDPVPGDTCNLVIPVVSKSKFFGRVGNATYKTRKRVYIPYIYTKWGLP